MVRTLQKHKKNGELYLRRPEVEAEITALTSLNVEELEKRCLISSQADGYISTEALLHFVRITGEDQFNKILLAELLKRFHRLLPWVDNAGGDTVSLTKTFIRDSVNDKFIENLISDQKTYNDKLDYYEVNFNHAVLMDRKDAQRECWRNENRQTTHETDAEEEEVLEAVDHEDKFHDPLAADEMDKIIYRRRLEGAIEELTVDQKRLIEMMLQDIPADSKDSSVITMSKVLGVNEKTARTRLSKALVALRKKLEFPGKST